MFLTWDSEDSVFIPVNPVVQLLMVRREQGLDGHHVTPVDGEVLSLV